MAIVSVNPTTGETIRTFPTADPATIERQLELARRASGTWAAVPVAERCAILRRAAEIFEADKRVLGEVATREMGKPIAAASDEAAKCATACRYYADHAPAFLAPEHVDGPDQAVHFEPLGVVLAVMPWNFPFWQVVRFAAPALAAGNVALLKHASNVPQCALALDDLFRRAGAPAGVFQTLLIESQMVDGIIADPRIAAVTLTGSEGAGRKVAASAGQHLKKCVLELGGSDPFIVLASADVDVAAATAVKARIVNNGQSCIAAKRFIAVDAVYERFVSKFVDNMCALRVGDPMRETTDVGPLATAAICDELARQVSDSVAAGARVIMGGPPGTIAGLGRNFFPPTVLVDVPPAAPAARDELFGPVAAIFRAGDTDQAIERANASRFGLGASVWTRDRKEAERVARELQVGSVFVNGMVVSDARFPFGGVKQSGYGRELGSFGLREFVNIKTVRLAPPLEPGLDL